MNTLQETGRQLGAAARITIMTGAGVSAASGIPTFRGTGGLWKNFRAEDLATPHAFERDPLLVWEWYDWRRSQIRGATPNAAHDVIAGWTRERSGVALVTQNVDGLHERAGTANITRLHGSIWELRCWNGCRESGRAWVDESVPLVPLPPRCRHCGGVARPGVVWFGEALDPADIDSALAACACDVFLTVGTSSIVYPAAGFVHEAQRHGAVTIEINPEATEASRAVDIAIRERAEIALPLIDRMITGADVGRTSGTLSP